MNVDERSNHVNLCTCIYVMQLFGLIDCIFQNFNKADEFNYLIFILTPASRVDSNSLAS
jgi:hypothetical protein